VILDLYVYPCKEFETEFNVFPPFVFVVTVITVHAIFVEPPGHFEEDERYVTVSSSFDPI